MPYNEKTTGYTIYTISNDVNDKLYVGLTQYPHRRWLAHLAESRRGVHKYPIYNAMRKYGADKFHMDIIETGLSRIEANHLEVRLIALFNARDPKFGYNLAIGGSRIYREWSEEMKIKIGLAGRGRKMPEGYGARQSERVRQRWKDGIYSHCNYSENSGRKPRPLYCHQNGKTYPKMEELLKDLNLTAQGARERVYQQLSGHIKHVKKYTFSYAELLNTPEDIERLSKVWERKRISDKHREERAAITKRQWESGVYDNCNFIGKAAKAVKCNETGKEYKSVPEMAKELGYSPTAIYLHLRTGSKHHSGLTFTYLKDNNKAA